MSGWLWALIILAALLALLLCTRLKVCVSYDEDGGSLQLGFGLLTVLTLPRKKKPGRAAEKTKKPKREKSKKKRTETPEQETKKGGSVPGFRDLTGIIVTLLGKLRRRLRVDELTLWYLSAAEDPAAAALAFGGANAAAGLLLEPLERAFRIRERDIRTAVSFTERKPAVTARLRLSLSLFSILQLGVIALSLLRKARKRASETEV